MLEGTTNNDKEIKNNRGEAMKLRHGKYLHSIFRLVFHILLGLFLLFVHVQTTRVIDLAEKKSELVYSIVSPFPHTPQPPMR